MATTLQCTENSQHEAGRNAPAHLSGDLAWIVYQAYLLDDCGRHLRGKTFGEADNADMVIAHHPEFSAHSRMLIPFRLPLQTLPAEGLYKSDR